MGGGTKPGHLLGYQREVLGGGGDIARGGERKIFNRVHVYKAFETKFKKRGQKKRKKGLKKRPIQTLGKKKKKGRGGKKYDN